MARFRGITRDNTRKGFRASITHNDRKIDIGRYDTVKEAEAAIIAARQPWVTHRRAED